MADPGALVLSVSLLRRARGGGGRFDFARNFRACACGLVGESPGDLAARVADQVGDQLATFAFASMQGFDFTTCRATP